MKVLVIAEKPSVGRDIARVLGCTKKGNGVIEGQKYLVTWGLGHLVTLADPEQYDKKYKEWKMEHLPMIPKPFRLEVIRQNAKQYSIVKELLHRKDVKEVVIATDAGREGELVARLILEKANCNKPIKRLWISSVTDQAIRNGFANLKNGHAYDHLYEAALCRAEADWLVGINATRALTCKYNAQLSCGRVQTPTLAMIAQREEKIRSFVPKPYYGMQARAGGMCLTWMDSKSKSMRSFDKERILTVERKIGKEPCVIKEVKRTGKRSNAPLLYDLTELQRDANKKYGFSAKETLNIMQRLYENHKVLTYPRTDSRYLSKDIVTTLADRLDACAVGPYRKLAMQAKKHGSQSGLFFVNDAKVSDHHAIIPTEQFVQLTHMTNEERKIYDLVVRRFFAVLLPPCLYDQIRVEASIGSETFVASGKVVKQSGWKDAYATNEGEAADTVWEEEQSEDALKEQQLPDVKPQDQFEQVKLTITEGKTKPPAPFNEATLLSAMERPAAYMENADPKLVKTLGETGGLGTVATRADIIEKLFGSFLLEKRGKDIYLTPKAKQLLELVPEDLKKPELTALWEQKLGQISKGQLQKQIFMKEIDGYTKDLIQEIKTGDGAFRHDNLTNTKCPRCGKRMLKVKGKNAELLVCQDRECGYRETIAKTTNARCPVCHKKMQLCGKGEGQIFVCACGHKEKLSAFRERRKKEGAGVSKKDVQKYLKQQKDEAINNPFADALAKLKL